MMHASQTSTRSDPVPAPAYGVPAAIEQLASAINQLDSITELLTNRLSGVLSPAPTTEPKSNNLNSVVAQSAMAEEISAWRRRVESINARVQDTVNRLEV